MGSCCCHTKSPCDNVEERSGLLHDDTKAMVTTGKPDQLGTCGPEGGDDLRKTPDDADVKVGVQADIVKVDKSPAVRETKPNYTQENGPLKEVVIQPAPPSPRSVSNLKQNSTRAQDEDLKDCPADAGQAEALQCTLKPLKKEQLAAGLTATNRAAEENPSSVQNSVPDISSLTAEAVCLENHTETRATTQASMLAAHGDDEGEGKEAASGLENIKTEASGQLSEVLSQPNTPLTAAVCQATSDSVVSQVIDRRSPSCAATDDSSLCKESGPELVQSHDICESSSGSEPTGLNRSGEERDSACYVGEPVTTALEDACGSSKSDQDLKTNLPCATTSVDEVTSSEDMKQDVGEEMTQKVQDKDGDAPKAKEQDEMEEEAMHVPTETSSLAGRDTDVQEVTEEEEQLVGNPSAGEEANEEEASAEEGPGSSEEDLYRGVEELSAGPLPAFVQVEDRCSLAPAMDILSYSEREWRGNTAKSALIRKGYKEMSQRFGSLRRVRGDNYCALRATLFQVLTHSTQLPSWLQAEDITMLPKQLEAQEALISQWTFPGECLLGDGTGDATLQLTGYMELLRNKWQEVVGCSSEAERQQLCERLFQGGEEELGLLEALKLLMLARAVELHSCMQAGGEVPIFCWLLFARDSSDCPRSFLSNHLSHVGLSAGLEQVEMFLLGYTLQCTIQVYRLYKADTEEFVTYYPDDHKDDWPSVCLVTEDDRHYNVPIVEVAERKELDWR